MLTTAHLEAHLDLDLADRRPGAAAHVLDLEHVGRLLRQPGQEPGERAGAIRQPQPQLEVATGGGHAVADHPHQQERVDVAAGEHDHHRRLEPRRDVRVEQRRHPHRACRLDDTLRPFQEQQQGLGDVLLADERDLVHQVAHDREGVLAGSGDGDPVGHRGHRRQRERLTGGQ